MEGSKDEAAKHAETLHDLVRKVSFGPLALALPFPADWWEQLILPVSIQLDLTRAK